MYDDVVYVCDVLDCGVVGFVVKDVVLQELELVLCVVYVGQVFLSLQILVKMLVFMLGCEKFIGIVVLLLCQCEILCCIGKGESNKEIVVDFGISVKMVEIYCVCMMELLGCCCVNDLLLLVVCYQYELE